MATKSQWAQKIDNPKCAITRACYYEPTVQRAYGDLALGYGFLIDPCPVRDPAKKASASYCTLSGRWRNDKRGWRGTVASAFALDENDLAERLV